MLSVQNLKKQFGHQLIFDSVNFTINAKERIGLLGRNGHGKSTLFRMLANQEKCDEGDVIIAKGYRLGFLQQHLSFSLPTVLAEGVSVLLGDAVTQQWKVEKVLSGLGFSPDDFKRHPSELSGGYQLRLNLAKVLLAEPNLLLLDEPTNFLDIVAIRWFKRFLKEWRNEAVIISHDRGFLDDVVTHIMGIHRKKLKKISGITADYYTQITVEEEVHEKMRQNYEKKQKKTIEFISKFRAKARQGTLVQSRIKALEKQEKIDILEKVKTLSFRFNTVPCQSKYLLEATAISFDYSESIAIKPLIDSFSLVVRPNDRICIIGKNGKGKSTLLNLLAGRLKIRSGTIRDHPQVEKGFFGQLNTIRMSDECTIEEEITNSAPSLDRKRVRDICGAMMFSGDNALKKIKVLSGGERCRVLLGKLLVMPVSLFLLDEPTHHLDIESTDAMIEAIISIKGGAVVMVTHSERMLYKIATKLIVFHHDSISIFDGGYTEFLKEVGWDEPVIQTVTKENSKEKKKKRAEFVQERSRLLAPYKKKVLFLEKEIEKLEDSLKKENQLLIEASQNQDGKAIEKLSKGVGGLKKMIEERYSELEEVSEQMDEHTLLAERERE